MLCGVVLQFKKFVNCVRIVDLFLIFKRTMTLKEVRTRERREHVSRRSFSEKYVEILNFYY